MVDTAGREAIAVLARDVELLREEVEELSKSTQALVDAWNTATGLVKFIRLLSTVAAAMGALYMFLRHGVLPKID